MDPLSVRMVRAALIWLAIGFTVGALMLSDSSLPGSLRYWFGPTHGHVLFVGWFLQFAIGIAYWLLPRQRSDELPFGYDERVGMAAFLILNAGLILRVIAEPAPRIGYLDGISDVMLILSSVAHVAAIGIIVFQLWGRVRPRPPRRNRRVTPETSEAQGN